MTVCPKCKSRLSQVQRVMGSIIFQKGNSVLRHSLTQKFPIWAVDIALREGVQSGLLFKAGRGEYVKLPTD
jgi:hypothetical protein